MVHGGWVSTVFLNDTSCAGLSAEAEALPWLVHPRGSPEAARDQSKAEVAFDPTAWTKVERVRP